MNHIRLNDHIKHASGQMKTVCVTAVLTALGVPLDSFHYTGFDHDGRRAAILRKQGYAVRSRKSKIGKTCSVGAARAKIAALDDPAGTKYMVMRCS